MERISALGRGTQIMLVAGVLLLIDTFLPWQDFDIGGVAESLGIDVSFSAWHGFWGWMLGLLTIVLLAWIVVRIAAVNVPLPVSQAMTAALLGTLVLFFAVIKNLADDESTIWSYIGVGLAILVAVGAWQTVQEAGGIEQLKRQMPSAPSSATPTADTPAAPPAPPPAPETAARETAAAASEPASESPPEMPAAPRETEAPPAPAAPSEQARSTETER